MENESLNKSLNTMEAFSIAGTLKMPSRDGIHFRAMEWTAKNKGTEWDPSCQIP